MYAIYKISFGEKVYIGLTSIKRLKRRWYEHKWHAQNGTDFHLYRAMNKYGIENFEFNHIASCKTLDDALETEKIVIAQYNSFGNNGFNSTGGGDSQYRPTDPTVIKQNAQIHSSRMKELWKDNDFRKKMSASLTGIKRSDETRENQSRRMKGKKPSEKCLQLSLLASIGSKRSEESKKKMSNFHVERYKDPKEHEKISAATKMAMKNPEIRKKMSEAKLGKKNSSNHNEKIKSSLAGEYLLTFSNGITQKVINLKQWCVDNPKYDYTCIRLVAKGLQKEHRGITGCEVLKPAATANNVLKHKQK